MWVRWRGHQVDAIAENIGTYYAVSICHPFTKLVRASNTFTNGQLKLRASWMTYGIAGLKEWSSHASLARRKAGIGRLCGIARWCREHTGSG